MADLKTSQEAPAGPLSGTEIVRGVQSGGNVKITTAAIAGLYTPTQNKGDLIVRGASADGHLPVGTNGWQLVPDSTQPLGVKWYDAVGALRTTVATTAGAGMVGTSQSGAGAVARTLADKAAELKTSSDFSGWSVQCMAVGGNSFTGGSFTGSGNLSFGYNNGNSITSGYANKWFGNNCGQAATTGFFLYAFGDQVLQSATTASLCNGFGPYTLGFLTTGVADCGFGDDVLRYATTASYCVGGGSQSQYNNLTGVYNSSWGVYSLRGTANPPDLGPGVGPSPNYCSAFGANSLYTATGTGLTGVGYSAGYNATGDNGTYLGTNAGLSITSGSGVSAGANSCNNAGQTATAARFAVFGNSSYGNDDSAVIGDSSYATGAKGISIGSQVHNSGANTTIIGYGLSTSTANVTLIGNSSNTGTFFYGGLQPQVDNTQPIGGSAARWSVVYAGTGTINTSDAREKQDIRDLSTAETAVAKRLKSLVKSYRWKDAVALKGDGARVHVGWIAQDVIAAFEAEGLDAFAYAVCCHDTWGDQFEEWEDQFEEWGDEYEVVSPSRMEPVGLLDANGAPIMRRVPEVTRLVREAGKRLIKAAGRTQTQVAGDRYGVRHDQLIAFILAAI